MNPVQSSSAMRFPRAAAWTVPAIWCLVMVAAALFISLGAYFSISQYGRYVLSSIPSLQAAEAARHLSRGMGFSSGFLTPLGLFEAPRIAGHPDLFSPPLYSGLLAFFFLFFGVGDNAILICALVLFLAQVVLLFVASERLFGVRVAVLATLMLVLNPLMLANVLKGGEMVLPMLLFSLFLCVTYAAEGRGIAWTAACGAGLGLCSLANPVFLAILIPAGAYLLVARSEARGARLLAFLGGFLALAGPWLVREWIVTGNPLWGLQVLPGLFDMQGFSTYAPARLGMGGIFSLRGAWNKLIHIAQCWGTLLAPVVIAAALQPLGDAAFGRVRNLVYAAFAFVWVFMGSARFANVQDYYLIFLPFACCVGAAFLFALFDKLGESRQALGAFIAVCLAAVLPIKPVSDTVWKRPASTAMYEREVGLVPPGEAIMSPAALDICWRRDRPAILLAFDLATFREMRQAVSGIGGIFLPAEFEEAVADGVAEDWEQVWNEAQSGAIPGKLGMGKGANLDGGIVLYEPGAPAPK